MKSESQIVPFLFEGESLVRAISKDGAPWFVANDVAAALGYARPDNAVSRHCKLSLTYPLETGGQVRHVNIIPEPDVYRLIIRSNLPDAQQFERWLFEDVLPAIRGSGAYVAPDAHVIEPVGEQVRDTSLKLRIVTEARQSFGCKASQQMWFKLGLDTVPAMYEASGPNLFTYQAVTGH